MGFLDTLQHSWNTFWNRDRMNFTEMDYGVSYTNRQVTLPRYKKNDVLDGIFNRIAVDVSMTNFRHVKIDGDKSTEIEQDSGLAYCLSVEANIDQSTNDFLHDLVYSMFDEGVVAVFPSKTKEPKSPTDQILDIQELRVGRITRWYPEYVEVEGYNDDPKSGKLEKVILHKRNVAIIDNPFRAYVDSSNTTLRRTLEKLALLDKLDKDKASGKLNLLIQMPNPVRNEKRRDEAKNRISLLEDQLANNRYGIAYLDATEKVTQVNQPATDLLVEQVKQLQQTLYNQFGLTENILNGTANESEMRLYYMRTIDPIVQRIASEFNRKFLSKTARTQGHKIVFYRDPFRMVPAEQMAALANTYVTAAILTPNEVREVLGYKPSENEQADMLYNPNIVPDPTATGMGMGEEEIQSVEDVEEAIEELERNQNGKKKGG